MHRKILLVQKLMLHKVKKILETNVPNDCKRQALEVTGKFH